MPRAAGEGGARGRSLAGPVRVVCVLSQHSARQRARAQSTRYAHSIGRHPTDRRGDDRHSHDACRDGAPGSALTTCLRCGLQSLGWCARGQFTRAGLGYQVSPHSAGAADGRSRRASHHARGAVVTVLRVCRGAVVIAMTLSALRRARRLCVPGLAARAAVARRTPQQACGNPIASPPAASPWSGTPLW